MCVCVSVTLSRMCVSSYRVCVCVCASLFVFCHGLAFIFPSRKQQQKLRNAKLTLHLRKWANTNMAEIEDSRLWAGWHRPGKFQY